MHASDFYSVIQWWATIFLIGSAFLPLTHILFKHFFDKGYIFSKLLGLAITSYLIFVLGLLHIVPFTTGTSYLIFFGTAAILFFILQKRQNIFEVLKQHWRVFLFEEILFFLALLFWAYIHSFAPDIHGLEKYMDYGFINSILRADYFPPKDMWFTPFFINYYYFGHLMTAVLTKLSNLPSNLTFNLMLSTIFAFCLTESFSIAANFYSHFGEKLRFFRIKRVIAGILSAILVTLGGNLHILYGFFKAYENESPVPIWTLPFLPFSFPNAYWYPNATRFIHNTIHEFPIYSWVVADLHGHVLDIPFVLLTIGLIFSFFIAKSTAAKLPAKTKKKTVKAKQSKSMKIEKDIVGIFRQILQFDFWFLLIIGFLLAVMYMTNAWDGAIYFLLVAIVIFVVNKNKTIEWKKIGISLAIIFAGFFVFTLPYNSNFKPFASGIGILCSPDFLVAQAKLGPFLFEADHCEHSPWWMMIMLYGFFYFFIISFLIFTFKTKKIVKSDQFILLIILLSTFLILLPEFIYVKDIYPAHYRANTMFKLGFQAFIMFSLASGYIIVRLLQTMQKKVFAIIYLIVAITLVSIVMLYPYQAINSYYGNLQMYQGLNGTAYLNNLYPDDFAAIEWLNNNIKGQPVILEAQGDSYTDYARVSTNTGLPTVLGWTVHEWLWRGTYDIPAPRIDQIGKMYESPNLEETKVLLKQYNIEYVFIGELEKQKYLSLNEEKFAQLGKIVFQQNQTKIYKIIP